MKLKFDPKLKRDEFCAGHLRGGWEFDESWIMEVTLRKNKELTRWFVPLFGCLLQSYQTDSWLAGISDARVVLCWAGIEMRNIKQLPAAGNQTSAEVRWLR